VRPQRRPSIPPLFAKQTARSDGPIKCSLAAALAAYLLKTADLSARSEGAVRDSAGITASAMMEESAEPASPTDALGAGTQTVTYVERSFLSKSTLEKATAAKLKLEKFYESFILQLNELDKRYATASTRCVRPRVCSRHPLRPAHRCTIPAPLTQQARGTFACTAKRGHDGGAQAQKV